MCNAGGAGFPNGRTFVKCHEKVMYVHVFMDLTATLVL